MREDIKSMTLEELRAIPLTDLSNPGERSPFRR